MKKTNCCDAFECACNCQNSTHTCPAGFITSSSTNDCGCTETSCQPDNVRVASLDREGFVSFVPPLLEASRFLTLSLCRCVWWVAWFTQWRANGNKGAKSALAHSCRTGTHRCTSLSVYRPCAIGRVLRWSRLNTKTRRYKKYFYIFYVILYTLTTQNYFKGKFLYVHNDNNLNLEYFYHILTVSVMYGIMYFVCVNKLLFSFFFLGLHIHSDPWRMLWEVHANQLCGVGRRHSWRCSSRGETQTGECEF